MKHLFAALAVLALCALPAVAMPKGSYLKRPALTKGALVGQISKDASVRSRYAEHWKVDDKTVKARMGALYMGRLLQTTLMRVYFWRDVKGYHVQTILKGTKVFTTASGKPVLLQECGNPLEIVREPILSPGTIIKPKYPAETLTKKPITPSLVGIEGEPILVEPKIPDFVSPGSVQHLVGYGVMNVPSEIVTKNSKTDWSPYFWGVTIVMGTMINHGGHHNPGGSVTVPEENGSGAFLLLGLISGGILARRRKLV